MEKCSNCGGAVRPGAKFCTSCGTRLNNDPTPAQPASSQEASANDTQVATPVIQPDSYSEDSEATESPAFSTWRGGNSGWGTGSEAPSGTSSPADRFEAALDSEPTDSSAPEKTSTETSSPDGSTSESESDEDRFASWAAAYSSSPAVTAPEENIVESATITPATDTARISETNELEVDDQSTDEPIAVVDSNSNIAASTPDHQSDARQRATTLVEELRGLIWKIGEVDSAQAGDTTDVLNGLTSARGATSDFSDLQSVISALRGSPKDIDALRELGNQSARLEELLDSHVRLTSAVDEAIRKLR